jgi:hypothetical protein
MANGKTGHSPLLLPARDHRASLADRCVVPFWKTHDKIMRVGLLCCPYDVLSSCTRVTPRNIVGNTFIDWLLKTTMRSSKYNGGRTYIKLAPVQRSLKKELSANTIPEERFVHTNFVSVPMQIKRGEINAIIFNHPFVYIIETFDDTNSSRFT